MMNWYKESQVILEKDKHDKSYFDIGHNAEEYNSMPNSGSDAIWVWYMGELFVEEDSMGRNSHRNLMRRLQNQLIIGSDWEPGSLYQGRFDIDNGKKRVSIKPSTYQSLRPIPNPLIRELRYEFGDDIEIYTF